LNDRRRANDLPTGVRRFIQRRIESVEQLEVLLFLYREASRSWDAPSVASTLYLPEHQVATVLETLARGGLLDVRLASVMLYRFQPATRSLMLDVKAVADAYRDRRSELLALVAPRPRQALKDFSDAFRFTEDPEDG
jgi:hypothetical protein